MAEVATHIWLDGKGVAWVDDTRVKVLEVAAPHMAWGWDANELHEQYPYLSLPQIHAALAYIDDHRESIEREILEEKKEIAALMKEFGESLLHRKLRELKYGR